MASDASVALTACLLHYDPASYSSGARLSWSASGATAKASPVTRATESILGVDPKPGRSTHEQGEAGVTPSGGPNRCGLKTARMTCG